MRFVPIEQEDQGRSELIPVGQEIQQTGPRFVPLGGAVDQPSKKTSNPFAGLVGRAAELAGSGIDAVAEVAERVGDRLDGFPRTDFMRPKSMTVTWNLASGNRIRKFMENHLVTKPDIEASLCKNCGICMKHCPPQAIRDEQGCRHRPGAEVQ